MSPRDTFDRILASLHDATLDDAHWPQTSALIDEACGTTGNGLVVGDGLEGDVRIFLAWFYRRGQRNEELGRSYFQHYHARDERLPDSRLVHVTELFTEKELKSSPTFNEALRRCRGQNSLNVRLDGPNGSRIVWIVNDPVRPGGWQSDQIELIERLLPHVRQFVRVRQAVAKAEARGDSMSKLLDNTRIGVIQLDRRGRIVEANDRARAILRQGNGLFDDNGFLHARLSADDARLERLLGQTLPAFDGQSVSGSMTVRRPFGLAPLSVHLSPVPARQMDFGLRRVAVLALVEDAGSRLRA